MIPFLFSTRQYLLQNRCYILLKRLLQNPVDCFSTAAFMSCILAKGRWRKAKGGEALRLCSFSRLCLRYRKERITPALPGVAPLQPFRLPVFGLYFTKHVPVTWKSIIISRGWHSTTYKALTKQTKQSKCVGIKFSVICNGGRLGGYNPLPYCIKQWSHCLMQ